MSKNTTEYLNEHAEEIAKVYHRVIELRSQHAYVNMTFIGKGEPEQFESICIDSACLSASRYGMDVELFTPVCRLKICFDFKYFNMTEHKTAKATVLRFENDLAIYELAFRDDNSYWLDDTN